MRTIVPYSKDSCTKRSDRSYKCPLGNKNLLARSEHGLRSRIALERQGIEKGLSGFGSRVRASQSGAAVVELAVLSLVMVPILLYALYFFDIARMPIKTQEVARFMLWEMTSFPLSGYGDIGHDKLFEEARDQVLKEARTLYADDLDSASRRENAPSNIPFFSGEASLTKLEIKEKSVAILPVAFDSEEFENPWIGKLLGNLNQTLSALLVHFGFNKNGQASVDVGIHFQNLLVPRKFAQEMFEQDLMKHSVASLFFQDRLTMIVDSWTLLDGRDVYPPGGYEPGKSDSLFLKQVARVAWMKGDKINDFLAELSNWLGQFGEMMNGLVDNPFEVRLASVASRGQDVNLANRIEVNVDCGQKHFHTTPIRDRLNIHECEYAKTFEKRGDFYMGCPEAEEVNCFLEQGEKP